MIQILIADDHPVTRRGLREILEAEADMHVIAEAASGEEVIDALKSSTPDVVVLALGLPGNDAFDVLRDMLRGHLRVPVLIFSLYPEDQYALRALQAGASGYLSKAAEPAELMNAVRRVAAGHRFFSESVVEVMVQSLKSNSRLPTHESLTDREFQIMRLIASGKPAKQIALDLHLSVKTIMSHRAQILAKLRLKNGIEVALYAMRNNLL